MDVSQLPAGVMYTSTGEWVVAEPDKVAWEQFQAKAKASAEKAEAAATGDQELRDKGLECSIDKRMFVDPMKTPCCGKTYCRDCIENSLLGNDFVCPGCSSDNVLVDNLVADEEMVTKIKEYEDEKVRAKKEQKDKSVTPPPAENKISTEKSDNAAKDGASSDKQDHQKSPSPKPSTTVAARATSTSGTPQPASSTDSKKRPAEEALENTRIPTGPAAMRNKQTAVPATPLDPMAQFAQQMNAMAGQQGMPFMPTNMNMNMGFNPMMGMPPMNMNMMGMPMPNMMMNGGVWPNMGGFGMPNMPNMNGMGNFNSNNNNQGNMYGNGNHMNNGGGYGRGGYGQNKNQGWRNNNNNGYGGHMNNNRMG